MNPLRTTLGAAALLLLSTRARAGTSTEVHREEARSPRLSAERGLSARSADGSFDLRLGLLSQLRYERSDAADLTQRSNFVVRMVRPQIRGSLVVPRVQFFVQPELAGASARLLDFEVNLKPTSGVQLRLGQFLTPFSRSFQTPVPRLQFPDFSLASDFFRADRDTGAMLWGSLWEGLFTYQAAVFNGNGINKGSNDDDRMLWMGRLQVDPLGSMPLDETASLASHRPPRLSLGVNAYRGEVMRSEQRADPSSGLPKSLPLGVDHNQTAGADLAFTWERFTSLVEIYARNATGYNGKRTQAAGGFVQVGLQILDRTLELAGRLDLLDPDRNTPRDQIRAAEALATVYVDGNHLKFQGRYTHLLHETDPPAHRITLQTQLFF